MLSTYEYENDEVFEDGTEILGVEVPCDVCNRNFGGNEKALRFQKNYYHPKCYLIKVKIYLITEELNEKDRDKIKGGMYGEFSDIGL